jgi:hypothetical protein
MAAFVMIVSRERPPDMDVRITVVFIRSNLGATEIWA